MKWVDIDEEKIRKLANLAQYFEPVLKRNYSSIFGFDVASRLPADATDVVKKTVMAVKALAPEKIRHDLLGKVFHELIPFEVRKSVEVFYTNNEAAEILAQLAIDKPDAKVTNLAVGSGTLLVAAYRRKKELLQKEKGTVELEDHKRFLEQDLTGVDIMPFAAHPAVVHLSLQALLYETEKVRVAVWDSTVKPGQTELQGKLLEFLWWVKKQGYKDTTIRGKGSRLRRLLKLGANLLDPESVKEAIAAQKWFDSGKETTAYAYDLFAKWAGLKWEKPRCKAIRKLPLIPLEREIDDLIAGCNKQIATFLQITKETGARAGEIFNLKWIDIDTEAKTVRITPEKGSNPRSLKISNKLVSMLNSLPKKGENIFSNYGSLSCTFERNRKKTAYKLGNPRLLKISFHTLRHWKATMEYHRTKDILHVMQILGHRNIKNTLVYTQLINGDAEDAYVCKAAKTVEQAAELIEAGFEYVCEIEGVKLFRKRR